MVSVACFGVRVFSDVSPYVCSLLVWFGLLSGHLLGNSCPLGWPFVLIFFYLFVIFIYCDVTIFSGGGGEVSVVFSSFTLML